MKYYNHYNVRMAPKNSDWNSESKPSKGKERPNIESPNIWSVEEAEDKRKVKMQNTFST